MKAMKVITGLLVVFLSMPITFYLQYRVMGLVGATNVMWLLFWVNLPVAVLIQAVAKITEHVKDD